MIHHLKGRIETVTSDLAIIDVGGVGYGVFASTRTLADLQPGTAAALHIITHVREDHLHLYGFFSVLERQWFEILTAVQGVGPKVALAILGALSPTDLANALMLEDRRVFQAVSGVGPKMAARLVTELRDKAPQGGGERGPVASAASVSSPQTSQAPAVTGAAALLRDLVSALTNLGYDEALARQAATTALASEETDLNTLIPLALRALAA